MAQVAHMPDAAREMRILVAALLGLDRSELFARESDLLTETQQNFLLGAAARRAQDEPLARILGRREFWGLDFGVNDSTIVPRPDSETIISTALRLFQDPQQALRCLDLGTGSGCLLLSLLHEFQQATGIGVDLHEKTVRQAEENSKKLELAERTRFISADWNSDAILQQLEAHAPFDLILANPPYVVREIVPLLHREVRDYDPLLALDGGVDGLDAYRRLAKLLPHWLTPTAFAIFEFGYDQAETAPQIFREHGFEIFDIVKDLTGQSRCMIVRADRVKLEARSDPT
jgi:release factor glutamine methyltransferase